MQLSSGSQIPNGLLAAMILRNENSRLGVPSKNPALHLGIDASKSQNAMGLQTVTTTTRIESRCTGKERDAESGLDNFGYRYYSSSMGRWMSPDPTGLDYADLTNPQSFNLYSYVLNNPLKFSDPIDALVQGVATDTASMPWLCNTSVSVRGQIPKTPFAVGLTADKNGVQPSARAKLGENASGVQAI